MESARIVSDFPATKHQWQEVCNACDYATYFHIPQWFELFSTYTQGRTYPFTRKIIFKDNCSAIIPLCRMDFLKGAIKIYQSAPAGTFGGWISSDSLSLSHTAALVEYMLGFGNICWRENPYDPFLKDIAIPGSIEEFTQTIDLTKSIDELSQASSRAHIKALSKARREGVIIKEADGLEEWHEHFKAYEQSLVRWKNAGTSKKLVKPYSWDLFKIIFNSASSYRKLWCAYYKGKIAAGVLCFYWKRHAVAWHGAALEEFFNVRPNNLLYQHMILHARENGYHWFDCNTPGGLKGVVEFKDHLGTQRRLSRLLDKTTIARKIVRVIKQFI